MFKEHLQQSAVKVKNNGYTACIYDTVQWIVRIM